MASDGGFRVVTGEVPVVLAQVVVPPQPGDTGKVLRQPVLLHRLLRDFPLTVPAVAGEPVEQCPFRLHRFQIVAGQFAARLPLVKGGGLPHQLSPLVRLPQLDLFHDGVVVAPHLLVPFPAQFFEPAVAFRQPVTDSYRVVRFLAFQGKPFQCVEVSLPHAAVQQPVRRIPFRLRFGG